jgi:hypothetical protein
MRPALIHAAQDPDLDLQRPGYCVEVPSAPGIGYLFACDIKDQKYGMCAWNGGAVGFCRVTGPIKIWSARYAADVAAEKTGGKVVTVPRRISTGSRGPVITWDEVRP